MSEQGNDNTQMTQGDELIIADSIERDCKGLRKLFTGVGYVCSTVQSMEEARNLIQRKFFPVALIDLDFCKLNGGLDLVRFIKEKSPPTRIVMLTGRRSFEAAVEALRLGIVDVVNKKPDQVAHLSGAVRMALDRYRTGDKDSALLREVRSVLDDAFKIMLSMGRKIYEDSPSVSVSGPMMKPTILLIDEDQQFIQEVSRLASSKNWDVTVEVSGGSGLDKASTFSFQIVAVCEQLIDLPGQMLIKSIQSQKNKPLGVLYSTVGPGHIDLYEDGRETDSERPFNGPSHLIEKLDMVVKDLATMQQERRYLHAFRSDHGEFLKRYAELKVRIDSLS